MTEREDMLAWLDRRIGNHRRIAENDTGSQERASWLRRELEIVRDAVAAGLHEGCAEMMARMAETALPGEQAGAGA